MIGRRDRALLALGFAGAFRRSELCALQVADLVEVPDGLRVADPAQQDRPGRAGAGGGHPARLPAAPGRGGADVAGRGGDQRRAGVPGRGARREGLSRPLADDSASPDREAVCAPGRAGCRRLQRPQPAQRAS